MGNKKRLTDLEDMHVGWKSLLAIIMYIISLVFFLLLILVVIAGAQVLFTTVDKNVITVLVPSVAGIFTYWLTKNSERKAASLQNARDENLTTYNEYITFILKERELGFVKTFRTK